MSQEQIEKIVSKMRNTQKSQKVFDSKDEPQIYTYLVNYSKDVNYLERLNIGIALFEGTNEYNAFAKIYLKNSLMKEILKKMRMERKNPIVFDSYVKSDIEFFKYLNDLNKSKLSYDGKEILIEKKSGGGSGMGEYGPEIKVYVLGTL